MKILFFIAFYFGMTVCFAQQVDTITGKNSIKVIARVLKNDITLRWGPNNAIAWKYANQYGYMVERYTIVQKGKSLAKPILRQITQEPIKPRPLEEWETLAKKDKYGAIAAQALYGKEFTIDAKGNSAISMVNMAEEQETRFSFAMFCADQSMEVANYLGLKLTDKFIFAGERYLYKIYSPVPHNIMAIDTGYVFVDADELEQLPTPKHLQVDFADRTALVSWDNIYHNIYSAYTVERSDDGGHTFKPINKDPFLTTSPNTKGHSDRLYMTDSLPQNNKKYAYRVRGESYFAASGPPSDTVYGEGITYPKALPNITGVKIINNTNAIVSWEFPVDMNKNIIGFQLATSTTLDKPLQNSGKLMDATKREWLIEQPPTSSYVGIKAIDAQGNEYPSAPYLVQLKDNTPPAAPTGLTGKIDTLGVVRLWWNASKEPDWEGYRVYMSNSPNDEYSQMTKTHLKVAQFTDTTILNTLSEKIYYKIVAIDHHFNVSAFSSVAVLVRPDKVPPAPPVISNCYSIDSGVVIQYLPSSSIDVVQHNLYRKALGSEQWVKIAQQDTNTVSHQYIDKGTDLKTIFYYTAAAIDKSGNMTYAIQPGVAKRLDNYIRPKINKFTVQADRVDRAIQLNWQYTQQGVSNYLLYRAEASQPLRLYKTLSTTVQSYQDKAIKIGNAYKYVLRAQFSDGGLSHESEELKITF